MRISQQGIAMIKKFEGFSAHAYVCPAGKLTIGYGHAIRPSEDFTDKTIDQNEAELLLENDIHYAEQAINRLVSVPVSQNQFDALTSFIYNIGAHAFENSTLLRALNKGDFILASKQFSRWIYYNGNKISGLVVRRAAEAALFRASA
jgi:lysozyme